MYQPTRFTCPMRSTLVSALGLVLVPKPSSLTSFLITSSACESSDFGWRTLMWYWFWKQLYKICLPGKSIFRDYIEENRTSIDLFSYWELVFREDLFLYNSSLEGVATVLLDRLEGILAVLNLAADVGVDGDGRDVFDGDLGWCDGDHDGKRDNQPHVELKEILWAIAMAILQSPGSLHLQHQN